MDVAIEKGNWRNKESNINYRNQDPSYEKGELYRNRFEDEKKKLGERKK